MRRNGDVVTEMSAWAWEVSGCDSFGDSEKGCEVGVGAWFDGHTVNSIEGLERGGMERSGLALAGEIQIHVASS